MPEQNYLDYAVIRVVPHPEREEFVNVGVILHCPAEKFLGAKIQLNAPRVSALDPELDLEMVREELEVIPRICAGGAKAGPLGELSQPERFRWLVSPRSTTIQISPVHGGICDTNPQAALEDLFGRFVVC